MKSKNNLCRTLGGCLLTFSQSPFNVPIAIGMGQTGTNSAVKKMNMKKSVQIINNPRPRPNGKAGRARHPRPIAFGIKPLKKQARFTNGLPRIHGINLYSTNYKSRKPFVNFYQTSVH